MPERDTIEPDEQGAGPALALTLSYDGADFSGFARQPGRRTVQGDIEQALTIALRRPIEVVGAGRTDAGVHARGQVVSFASTPTDGDDRSLLRSLNALCGEGVAVRRIRRARPGFSARFDALSREYRYRIVAGPVPPLFLSSYVWWTPRDLDTEAMAAGAAHLLGEHDFKSFCLAASAVDKTTMRRLDSIDFTEEEHLGERCLTVRIVGNAFLHSMVRVIIGTLAEVGAGRRAPDWVAGVLDACDRSAAGPTAPAHGLTLWHVEYPDDVWL